MQSDYSRRLVFKNVFTINEHREGKFGVNGDTVNTGARPLAQVKGNEILVSPETQRLISPYFKTEALEPVNMKGKAEPVVPYRILSKTTIQTRIEAAEQRGFTTYTGRDEELATLQACQENTIQGEGQEQQHQEMLAAAGFCPRIPA